VGGLVLAWLFGEGMIFYRWSKHKAPPPPGALLDASLLFVGLAVVGEYPPARTAATIFAWGVDIAVLLQVIGKEPNVKTNWPPLCIPDTQLMPSKAGGVPCGQAQTTAAATTTTGAATKTIRPTNPANPGSGPRPGEHT
jgi:hypothetical protein